MGVTSKFLIRRLDNHPLGVTLGRHMVIVVSFTSLQVQRF